MHKYIDISHTIGDGTITYKGLPAPVICDYLSREEARTLYAEGEEFQIGKIEMVANTGTYIDCPFHRYENGKDLSAVELERFVDIPAVVVPCDWRTSIEVSVDYFRDIDVLDKAVLINTGWAEHWGTDQYFVQHPYLTPQAADYLRDKGCKIVVIDSHNIDDTRKNSRPVHSILLKAEILIVEHACNVIWMRYPQM